MRRFCLILVASLFANLALASSPIIVDHENLYEFELGGNLIRGIATPSLGAQETEVWRTSWAPGCCTPIHSHDSEEIFIILKGKGTIHTATEEMDFEAPCTLILPANVQHKLCNTGTEETDCIVIMRSASAIYNHQGDVMLLPWRH